MSYTELKNGVIVYLQRNMVKRKLYGMVKVTIHDSNFVCVFLWGELLY